MRTVLLGDSHLARVRRRLHLLGPDVVNAAVGGATSGDLAAQADGASIGSDDVAVVSVGTNDAAPWKATPPEDFAADLRALVERFRPHQWVYVSAPGVCEERLERAADRTNRVTSAYRLAAAEIFVGAGGLVLPAHELIDPLGPRAFTDDGVHLAGAGYDVLLEALAALLEGVRSSGPIDR